MTGARAPGSSSRPTAREQGGAGPPAHACGHGPCAELLLDRLERSGLKLISQMSVCFREKSAKTLA